MDHPQSSHCSVPFSSTSPTAVEVADSSEMKDGVERFEIVVTVDEVDERENDPR
jgi:hypothetical protein